MDFKNRYLKNLNQYFSIKNVSLASLILNLASTFFGVVYIAIPIYTIIWDVFGAILLFTLMWNVLLVHVNNISLNKNCRIGKRMNAICYLYLVYTIFSMFAMLFTNFFISVNYSNDLAINIGFYTILYVSYFGILTIGVIIAKFDVDNLSNDLLWDSSKKTEYSGAKNTDKTKKILKATLKVLCSITFSFGVYFAYIILNGGADFISGMIGIFISQFALFGAFILLSTTFLLLKLINKQRKKKLYEIVAIVGLVMTGIFMLPSCLTPYAILDAENNFSGAFGRDYESRIDPDAEKYFLQAHFSIPEYYLGIPPKDCIVKEQIQFYEGEGIRLYFDAYMPLNQGNGLPGKNSTIIRVHGGGWAIGDKGRGNMMQMNKYFAAQGYIVFDIQYGLRGTPGEGDLITPDYVKGDFNIDDMVRHIGIFTKYISAHSREYGANLASVFVSGGSAGGQLTCAAGLGIASGKFKEIFGTRLKIKGIVPYYPANIISGAGRLEGIPELLNPEKLVDGNSPPCLIFHGTQDGLVDPYRSQSLKDTYTSEGNLECAIIWLPLAGHAGDIYFTGYYNQVFLYYMERFLFLYQ